MKNIKKILFKILCVALGLISVFGVAGCGEEADYNKNVVAVGSLSREEVIELRQEYFDFRVAAAKLQGQRISKDKIVKVRIKQYYGELSGYPVMIIVDEIWSAFYMDSRDVVVDDVYLGHFPDSDAIIVQDKSAKISERFVNIKAAYEKGLVSRDDLKEFAMICGSGKAVGDLSKEEAIEIRQAYIDAVRGYKKNAATYNIDKYLGAYNGAIVLNMKRNITRGTSYIVEIVIDGVYVCTKDITKEEVIVYNAAAESERDMFISLQTAYENGILTKEDLYRIAEQCAEETQQ